MNTLPSRDDLRASLPWLVNDTLDEPTRRALNELIRNDLPTRRDWLEARALASFIATEDTFEPSIARDAESIRSRASTPRILTRIAACLLVAMLGVAGFALHRAGTPTYATLSSAVPAAPTAGHVRLRLQLATPVAHDELSKTLRAFDAALVAGPPVAGLHTIEVPIAREAALRQHLQRRYALLHLERTAY